jgi:hypothetical protein
VSGLILLATVSVGLLGLRGLSALERSEAPSPLAPAPPEPLDARSLHLGTSLVPPSTPLRRLHTYEWHVESLVPADYRLGYGLSEELTRSLERAHQDHGVRLGFHRIDANRFTYRPPPGCQQDMHCIYTEMIRSNLGPVSALGSRFVEHIQARHLEPREATELIITFIQHIHYVLPEDQPFGLLPPALVAAWDQGDCDSKAVLAVMLLRQVGIDAVILYSDPLSHVAVGVALPVGGPPFRLGERVYRYAEVTSEGWPLGMIPPQHDRPHLWKVLPVDEAG